MEQEVFDRTSGEILEHEVVKLAKKEELVLMEKMWIYADAATEECFAETDGRVWRQKWGDVNEGTAENQNRRFQHALCAVLVCASCVQGFLH